MIVEYFVINTATGEMVNHIVVDDTLPEKSKWIPPDGFHLIPADNKVGFGWKWDGTKFVNPNAPTTPATGAPVVSG